jgi:uncharacterized protein
MIHGTRASQARLAFAAAVLCCLLRPAAGQAPDSDARERPTISVNGSAEVAVTPDRAVVRLGVQAESSAAAASQQEVNRVMREIVEAVKAKKIPERAIRTEDLSLFPVYDTAQAARPGRQPEQRIVAYRASNVVSVELTDLAAVGGVVDAGIAAGANQVQGITFGLRDDASVRAAALRAAVADARAQAETVAAALGMRLDGVSEVSVSGGGGGPPVPLRRVLAVADTVVQPGEVSVSANVSAKYFLAPTEGGRN